MPHASRKAAQVAGTRPKGTPLASLDSVQAFLPGKEFRLEVLGSELGVFAQTLRPLFPEIGTLALELETLPTVNRFDDHLWCRGRLERAGPLEE